MTTDLRWRFMSLQALMLVVFASGAVFLFWAADYTHSSVRTQLAAQQITFPPFNSPAITAAALTPCASLATSAKCPIPTGAAVGRKNSAAMMKYSGETMTTGTQAQTYADSFIGVHLSDMGYTYSGISGLALLHPTNATYQTIDATIFKGTTLRGMLLNTYGWWTIGTYTGYAALVALAAAAVVLCALIFECVGVFRRQSTTKPVKRPSRQPRPVPVAEVVT